MFFFLVDWDFCHEYQQSLPSWDKTLLSWCIFLYFQAVFWNHVKEFPFLCCCRSVAMSCLTFAAPWTAARWAALPFTISWRLPSSCPMNWWCDPTISSSVALFSFCLQSFPESAFFSEPAVCIRFLLLWTWGILVCSLLLKKKKKIFDSLGKMLPSYTVFISGQEKNTNVFK